jgi:hypothetical protein
MKNGSFWKISSVLVIHRYLVLSAKVFFIMYEICFTASLVCLFSRLTVLPLIPDKQICEVTV